MSPACSQAVGLPEIVAAILEQTDNTKALWAALQVNRLWADEATTLLWRENSPINALHRIKDNKRRQYYADKISSLDALSREDECEGHYSLHQLRFPRLSKIRANILGYDHMRMFLRGPQPRLRTLEWCGGPISSCHLEQVQAWSPALRSLRLTYWDRGITGKNFLQFLENMPSLTKLNFGCDPQGSIHDDVYVHLASRPNLTSLETNHTITLGLINQMQGAVQQPFPELVHLKCHSESKAISQLSRHLTELTKIDLILVDAAENMVFDICSCTRLVSLELYFLHNSHFDAKSHFPPESLLALADSCSHLQNFSVTHAIADPMYGHGITDINDDVIQKFVALLPGLSRFRLQIQSNVTDRALKILGQGCASMKDCALAGKIFNLQLLGNSGPVLFPQLENLKITPRAVGHSADEIAQIFHHHAPRARILMLDSRGRSEREN